MIPLLPVILLASLFGLAVAAKRAGASAAREKLGAIMGPGGFATLSHEEKVALYRSLPSRSIVQYRDAGGAEEMLLVPLGMAPPAGKRAAKAEGAVYAINMGKSDPPLAILVKKERPGEADEGGTILVIPKKTDGWKPHASPPFGDAIVFLLPREAEDVAREAMGPPRLLPAVTTDVLTATPIKSLAAIADATSGEDALSREVKATTKAIDLPSPWEETKSWYAAALNDSGLANASKLDAAVETLRKAGFDLAASQIQVLLARLGFSPRAAGPS